MSAYLHALSPTGELIPLQCDADGKLYIEGAISLDSAVLPDGAATSAKQDSMIARLPAALTSGGGLKTGLVDALPAGTNTIGTARNAMGYVESTPSLDTNIYASGDVLFVPTAIAFASANGGRGLLHSVVIIDKDDQGQALDLVFLRDTTTTFGTINGAVGIDDTDAGQILGTVSISSSDYIDLGGCKVATAPNIGLTLRAASGNTGCYVAGISRGTGTYTGTGLIIKFGIAALD